MQPDTTHAVRIRELHDQAHKLAAQAIDHALECGRLLTEVKAALPHGRFTAWVAEQCGFSDRTARRYMKLHAHRDTLPKGYGIRAALEHIGPAKSATVSDSWLPAEGAVEHRDRSGAVFTVWRVGDYAHALRRIDHDDGALLDATRRPIRADRIGDMLAHMGLPEPAKAGWQGACCRTAEAYRRFVFEDAQAA